MKKFVKITQTYHVVAIIEVNENETHEETKERILDHIKYNGGADVVINQGGEIDFDFLNNSLPRKIDENDYECID